MGVWDCEAPDALVPKMTSINIFGKNRRFTWNMNPDTVPFNKSCDHSELTVNGMKQQDELGKYFRKRLVDDLKFLPELYDPELISLRSSGASRCVKSAIAFTNGMYPPRFMNELLEIKSGLPSYDRLNPDPYVCADLVKAYEEFKQTEEFKARAERAKVTQAALYEYLNLPWDGVNWMWLGDWMYSYDCSGQTNLIPGVVTDEMFELAMNDTMYFTAGLFRKYTKDASGPIWRLLLNSINKRLGGLSKTKFELFSGHDVTLLAMRAALGYVDETIVSPYRSHLIVELYDDNGVPKLRFVYNGKVMPVKGKELIKLGEFKNLILPTLTGCLEMH